MEWLTVTLALYARVFRRAGVLIIRNWQVLASVFVYTGLMTGAALLGSMLGLLGGLLVTLVWASCVGSFLFLVEAMVRTGRASLEDFRRSFGAYLWDVVGVLFVFWVVSLVLGPLLAGTPNGALFALILNLAIFVFFNAVPELIYLGHFTALQLLRESYVFIGENWVEWFPPTLLLGLAILVAAGLPIGGVLVWLRLALVALVAYFAMVVRGLLFLELHGSTRRARAFRHRTGGWG